MESDAAYNEAVECINSLFTAIFAMERKYEQQSFEWSEIEQEYQKSFNKALAVESISLRLALVFGGESRQNAARFVKCQLRGIMQCMSVDDAQQKSVRNNPLVQCLAKLPMTEKKAATSPRGSIALAYEAFKRYHGYVLEQWRARRAPLIQATPPLVEAPPTDPEEILPELIDLIESPPGSPTTGTVTNSDEAMNGDAQPLLSFFASLLTMEERFGLKPFKWENMVEVHQKLFNETLTLEVLTERFGFPLNDSKPKTIRYLIFSSLNYVLNITKINNGTNPTLRFLRIPYTPENILVRAPGEPFSRSFIASQYKAYKASRGVGAEQNEAPLIPPPLVLQVLFTTFLALERQFGEAEFTWEDMVEMHRKLCGETLTPQLLERVFGGIDHNNPTLRGIIGMPLMNVLELTDKSRESGKVNPRMRFRKLRILPEEALKTIKWTPGEPMSTHFVQAHYAAFKASQVVAPGQTAPPLLLQAPPIAPASVAIKQEIIDPTMDTVPPRKKKRQIDAGEENIGEDEPKIKKKKKSAEVLKVKEEPNDPIDEPEKKDKKKKTMKNVKVEQVDE